MVQQKVHKVTAVNCLSVFLYNTRQSDGLQAQLPCVDMFTSLCE